MGRLSTNLSSLEHSMQSAHFRRQLTLRESDSLHFARRLRSFKMRSLPPRWGSQVLAAPSGVASELIS